MSYDGPLLTRQFGPNPKGSKLTIQEMDDNLLFLSQSAASAFPFTGSAGISGSVLLDSQLKISTGAGPGYSGVKNIAIGTTTTLQNNTTGAHNIAMGKDALASNTNGQHSVAMGQSALKNNSGFGSNIAIGRNAGYANTSGVYNISLGNFAGSYITTGNKNISIGYNCHGNTTGGYNIGLGDNALYYNTTGNNNIAIGSFSTHYNTTGYNNVAIGISTLTNNQTSDKNTAVGKNALRYHNGTGGFNTGVGYNVQSGNFSGSLMLGAGATATTNGQLAIGSSGTPIGPLVASVVANSSHTLDINLNGSIYKIMLTT